MKKLLSFILLFVANMIVAAEKPSAEILLLDGWKFMKGSLRGAEQVGYDDSMWQDVTIPHDWAISGPFELFDGNMPKPVGQEPDAKPLNMGGQSGQLPWIGEGWYRTIINIPEGYDHAELQFDGAMQEPSVYLDGELVGYWAYGYSTFRLDVSKVGAGKHLLAVHLRHDGESTRWYPGSGLYRPVRMLLGQKVGVETWGVFARTTMLNGIDDDAMKAKQARLTITTKVRVDTDEKKSDVMVRHILLDENEKEVARTEHKINDLNDCEQVMDVSDARLWNPEHPVLYTLVTEVVDGQVMVDRQQMKTGIRSVAFTEQGFLLNGKVRKFKGVCLHHDLGPVGAAFNKAAFRRQVSLLKEIGCDAIRTSHNMPAPWQMDICDEMGMLVVAESLDNWITSKVSNGYGLYFNKIDTTSPNADGRPWWQRDFENMVLVHRNHPSIVLWSIGNEIPEQDTALGLKYTREIQDFVHRLDPTRLCTQGMDKGYASVQEGTFQATDIPGYNYRLNAYEFGQANSPRGIILGSETASTVSSRGVYKFPIKETHGDDNDPAQHQDGQVSSYDMESCIWSNVPDDDWVWQDKAPWVVGEFVWTGFDYLGEPIPYNDRISRSSYFGIYDLSGLPKDRAFLYRVHWAPEKETLHVLPHWNWQGREGEKTPVFVYTSYPETELFINGKSQGRKRHHDFTLDEYKDNISFMMTPWNDQTRFGNPEAPEHLNKYSRYRMRWLDTVYEPGEVRVVAYDDNGQKAAEKVLRTAGKPHHIVLSADRLALSATPCDGNGNAIDTPDLSFVTVNVVDKDGNLCPNADNQLSFSVKGDAAVFNSCCNGDPISTEVFTQPTMRAFNGQLVVVVQATKVRGDAQLIVKGKNLKSQTINISVK